MTSPNDQRVADAAKGDRLILLTVTIAIVTAVAGGFLGWTTYKYLLTYDDFDIEVARAMMRDDSAAVERYRGRMVSFQLLSAAMVAGLIGVGGLITTLALGKRSGRGKLVANTFAAVLLWLAVCVVFASEVLLLQRPIFSALGSRDPRTVNLSLAAALLLLCLGTHMLGRLLHETQHKESR